MRMFLFILTLSLSKGKERPSYFKVASNSSTSFSNARSACNSL